MRRRPGRAHHRHGPPAGHREQPRGASRARRLVHVPGRDRRRRRLKRRVDALRGARRDVRRRDAADREHPDQRAADHPGSSIRDRVLVSASCRRDRERAGAPVRPVPGPRCDVVRRGTDLERHDHRHQRRRVPHRPGHADDRGYYTYTEQIVADGFVRGSRATAVSRPRPPSPAARRRSARRSATAPPCRVTPSPTRPWSAGSARCAPPSPPSCGARTPPPTR